MSDVDYSFSELAEDPNAATHNQMMLKRLETAIRRHCSCELMLKLDGISLLSDPAQIRAEILSLQKSMQEK